MAGYVYILRCGDGSLYTGWTTNMATRLAQHAAGRGAKYTRSRLPVTLVYSRKFRTQAAARRREYAIKQLERGKKLALLTK